jgi:hypothetical protein
MTNSSDNKPDQVNVTPWRCWLGSSIAGSLAFGAYFLTTAIATAFASKPLSTTNITALNIGVAVRTLVIGITALATGICSLIAIGLFALGIQVLLQKNKTV